MSRADEARSNQVDEIPLAQRANPIQRFSSGKLRLVASVSITLGISGTFFASNLFLSKNGLNNSDEFRNQPSRQAQLLGHYKYQEASQSDLVVFYPGFQVHKDIYAPLKKMERAALRDGIELVFLSGFRSIELQKRIFYENKSIRNQIAIERSRVSAPPGYSEHSTGYAVDIGDRNMRETDFEIEFESTPAYRWLQGNAAKFHFVLSFPRGNPQKVSYEPWHWRYEGSVEALKQFDPANKVLIDQKFSN